MTLPSGNSSTRTAAAAAAAVTVVTVTTAAAAAAAAAAAHSSSAVPQKLRDPITLDELGSWTWAFKYAASARCSEHAVREMTAAATVATLAATATAAVPAVASVVTPRPAGISDGPELGELAYTLDCMQLTIRYGSIDVALL
jgi:hypothetical protein